LSWKAEFVMVLVEPTIRGTTDGVCVFVLFVGSGSSVSDCAVAEFTSGPVANGNGTSAQSATVIVAPSAIVPSEIGPV
jgi:hypothetical protein